MRTLLFLRLLIAEARAWRAYVAWSLAAPGGRERPYAYELRKRKLRALSDTAAAFERKAVYDLNVGHVAFPQDANITLPPQHPAPKCGCGRAPMAECVFPTCGGKLT